jgi:hypothetical protein
LHLRHLVSSHRPRVSADFSPDDDISGRAGNPGAASNVIPGHPAAWAGKNIARFSVRY